MAKLSGLRYVWIPVAAIVCSFIGLYVYKNPSARELPGIWIPLFAIMLAVSGVLYAAFLWAYRNKEVLVTGAMAVFFMIVGVNVAWDLFASLSRLDMIDMLGSVPVWVHGAFCLGYAVLLIPGLVARTRQA